jgi:sarcosine oxidase subunit gamma
MQEEGGCVADDLKLEPASPVATGLLPIAQGDWVLEEVAVEALHWLSPKPGARGALDAALTQAHGLGWPAAGQSVASQGARIFWSGRDQAMLMGVTPAPELADHAALTVQSDAWCALRLRGAGGDEVLARLCPVDLRPRAFPDGAAARSLLQHATVSIVREDAESLLIFGFRSMAGTLVHEITTAMASVVGRARAG